MKKISVQTITGIIVLSACFMVVSTAGVLFAAASDSLVPVPGMVTMVDIGAKKCIPCKMMAPIIEELEEEYKGKAAIVFIDVWENPSAGGKYGIQVIPTQIFYDASGKEMLRHQGFLDKAAIVAELQKLGVK